VLLGGRRGQGATAGEIAHALDTIPYEVVAALNARVPRVYLS
jgi:alanine racemase